MSAPALSAPPGGVKDRLVGKVLGGRYRVLSRLGEGGMGTVYLCEHAVLHRRMAVKVLRPDLGTDPELADRFRNEAIAASRIGQENVVDVLDFGTAEDGSLYYVMEALEGRSLGATIREDGALPLARALDVLEQICRALAAAHARGVVHRDVKPDNVFLARQENGFEIAKVIDFGISHVPSTEGGAPITHAGAIIGTPEYMAPEQAAGDPIDRRSDVYAVGVLAFEMLTGELPISAETPIATLVAQQTRAPDPPSRRRKAVPSEVDALVLRALAKKPDDRFPSMEAFASEVARVRAAFGRRARESGSRFDTVALPEARDAVRRATGRSRRRARLALVALGVLVATAAVAAFAARTRGTRAKAVDPGAGAGAAVVEGGLTSPISNPTSTATSTSTSGAAAGQPAHPRDPAPGRGERDQGSTSTSTPTSIPPPIPRAPETTDVAAVVGPGSAPPAEARPRSRRTAVPAAPRAPVLIEDGGALPAPDAAPARAKGVQGPVPVDSNADPADDLKDPYSTGGDLKDPFK